MCWTPSDFGSIKRSLKQAWKKEETDIHYKIMQENYKDVPIWWYVAILLVGFFTGLGAVIKGHTTLDAWAYVCAIVSLLCSCHSTYYDSHRSRSYLVAL